MSKEAFLEIARSKMQEIIAAYKQFNPSGEYLDLCYINNQLMIYNANEDEALTISESWQMMEEC